MSGEIEYGPDRYTVEYMLKGESKWRRTMEHPLDVLPLQDEVLWENPSIEATRRIRMREEICILQVSRLRSDPLAE